MDLSGKQVLIVGLGRSGVATARFAAARGARVTVNDAASREALEAPIREMAALEIDVISGGHPVEAFTDCDLVVLSPGVPHTMAPVQAAVAAGIPVMGEMALACRFTDTPMVAVTGTNGKTTVTTMIGEMLSRSGKSVFVGGNIGTPLIAHVASGKRADVLVVEVSSFQLDTAPGFRPAVSVLLNITEDHMDRYADFQAYAVSKAGIFKNQTDGDIAVFNGDDPVIALLTAGLRAVPLAFSRQTNGFTADVGATFTSATITITLPDSGTTAFDITDAPLAGDHNRENMSAAVLAAMSAGADTEAVQAVLSTFRGLPHRLETVAERSGVSYVNDSKATNVDAVLRALQAYSQPVILIMGGRDKGGSFEDLAAAVRDHVKHLVVVGESRHRIAEALDRHAATTLADTLADGVQAARRLAAAGDVVLLSPGCASFDAFTSYAHRGASFRQYVEALP
ncbi:MAG: UDP-N-acetylmuramoyl-L-alanine--D-glutamate ligase [Pseudomonadota bacterium]